MEQHNEALALKYRPMDFDELVGQEAVSRTLSLALESKRLSHAYLFSGLRGSGKTSSARIFARALQCENGPKAKPCGVCANCVAANPHKMSHIDIIELDGASSRKIDDIRDLIEQTKYRPNMGRYKIFIIDEVHMLTKEAFNALLKTLEEPPEYVKFILATTDPLKLPATILSRTQHFRFKRISDKSIFNHLKSILHKENITYQDEALNMLIRSGSGSLRDTLTLLDQVIIYSNYNITAESCASMLGLINPQSLSDFFDEIFKKDKKALLETIEGFFEYECEMLLDEMSIFLKDKLLSAEDVRYSPVIVDRFFRIITQAKQLLSLGCDDNFVLTLSIFKMLEALKIDDIDKTIKTLEQGLLDVGESQQNLKADRIEIPKQESIVTPKAEIKPQSIKGADLFALLVKRIYERNYELGEIFEKNIHFISYENGVLTWGSCATGEEKQRLSNSYSNVIKGIVLEIFGIETRIEFVAQEPKGDCNQTITQEKANKTESIKEEAEISKIQEISTPKEEQIEIPQYTETPKATIKENQDIPTPQKNIQDEVNEALELPLLQKAKELLEIRQIKVRPKAEG
ncbi:DNA polymerase III subunit gamma/tau [Helicobacter pullorum]|uniref:DNA polymerase III subunit gamma/tau n=1 Tax=Helicobacter pullorum TaxID=35818 RepID=UPI000816ADED|nr:DNA polymerase III subunit gamma/tau [Helicobacter pullorum]OCR20947.1 DNA polymerase III subunit gamma/tau [Helicobacter pullorum]